jgi:Uma2 family endonuclease
MSEWHAVSHRSVADLLDELGGIEAERVVVDPAPGRATEADLVRLAARVAKRFCELIDGTLVEKSCGFRESVLGGHLGSALLNEARRLNSGIVVGANAPVRLWPGRVRIPDGAFYSWNRLSGRRIPEEPIPAVAPDLAFDVLKPGNTSAEMERKRNDYLRTGVQLVWQIDPRQRTVAVFAPPDHRIVLGEIDTLSGSPVLPDFVLPLAVLFGELDLHG